MYNKAGKWERAFKVCKNQNRFINSTLFFYHNNYFYKQIATAYLSKQEVTSLYSEQAKMLEQQGRYKEAEK